MTTGTSIQNDAVQKSHSAQNVVKAGFEIAEVGTERAYFRRNGKPLLSFGGMADVTFYLNQDAYDYKRWATWMAEHGMNHIRAYLPLSWKHVEKTTENNGGDVLKCLFPYQETEPGSRKFNLEQFDERFWKRFRHQTVKSQVSLKLPSSGTFSQGHALVIGIANYPMVRPLPRAVLNDARDIAAVLVDPATCGYPPAQTTQLLNNEATADGIRAALADLSAHIGPDDTVFVFFSGHGAHHPTHGDAQQYLLPFDCNPAKLSSTAIAGDEMTAMLNNIKAGRLLVLFDSCHSGGAGDPKKAALQQMKLGLSEDYYQALAQGKGRVVIASSRSDEPSWILPGARNSLFTHYLLEALRGQAKPIGDGYVRVFDLFRHIAEHVPTKANQHPIFKATAMEEDFVVALTPGRIG